MIQNVNEIDRNEVRKTVSQRFAKMMLKPNFYESRERDKIEAAVEVMMGGGNANIVMGMCPEMFTFLPPVSIDPLESDSRVRAAEAYGFTRMGMASFMLRASTRNVKSCHGIEAPGRNYSVGQLRYLSNPFWACYGIYNQTKNKALLLDEAKGLFHSEDLKTPNLLSTVNALLCYNEAGYPAVMLSRIYGEFTQQATMNLVRLVDYLTYNLGLPVYVASRWYSGQGAYLGLSSMFGVKKSLRKLWTPTVEPLVNLYSRQTVVDQHPTFDYGKSKYYEFPYQPQGYEDISLPYAPAKVEGVQPNLIFERHDAILLANAASNGLPKFAPFPGIKTTMETYAAGAHKVHVKNVLFLAPVCRETGVPLSGVEAVITAKAGVVTKTLYDAKKHGKIIIA